MKYKYQIFTLNQKQNIFFLSIKLAKKKVICGKHFHQTIVNFSFYLYTFNPIPCTFQTRLYTIVLSLLTSDNRIANTYKYNYKKPIIPQTHLPKSHTSNHIIIIKPGPPRDLFPAAKKYKPTTRRRVARV